MQAFSETMPLWDLSQASTFSQLPDDDFLALLQKQFPTPANNTNAYSIGGFADGVNPQSISRYSLSSMTPPSEDSSPSPPGNDAYQTLDDDHTLKRKASDDDMDDSPSQKNQHTSSNDKKGNSSKRKSLGGPVPDKDEHRLMKRKEQNRAAQRAFRERKEKHVKDLEDKVAALEAKNEQAASENENLRDLLSRLQHENVVLKQSSFTFSVPKTSGSTPTQTTTPGPFKQKQSDALNLFGSLASTPAASSSTSSFKPAYRNMDWNSLTAFDPAALNILDDAPQTTATDGAMQMDFGFGVDTGLSSNSPYKTIISNPALMSFASAFESNSPAISNASDTSSFNFDMGSLSAWPTPSATNQDSGSLDDLFGNGYLSPHNQVDFHSLLSTPGSSAVSPILHTTGGQSTSSSSPASNPSPLFSTPKDSPSSSSESSHEESECPKSKSDMAKHILSQGSSPFAPPATAAVRKSADSLFGPMVMCQGSSFPKTEKSDQNIEVLSAWRSITSNPKFKDADINELCTQFTAKARCDGTKVVLEPQGVRNIIENLSSKQK